MSDTLRHVADRTRGSAWLRTRSLLVILLACAVVHAITVLVLDLFQPLVDQHSFRQTQTAISAYWLAKGGPVLAYETPVLGSPWSVPFEFPLFQYVVALASCLGLPMDATGRATSFLFFVAALWPLQKLFRHLRLEGEAYLYTSILMLTCPLLLYWGRAFMIESCAVFLGLLWLALLAQYVEERRSTVALAALVAGCLAALVKFTTFPSFAAVGGVIAAARLWPAWRRRRLSIGPVSALAVLALVPFAVGYGWVKFSDNVKAQVVLGRALTSDSLLAWNIGTVAQRLSGALWIDTLFRRVLPDILGLAIPLAGVVLAASLTSRRCATAVGVALSAFLLPFVLFTNLHLVHNYYQAANAIFLVAAVGIAFARLDGVAPRPWALVLLCLVIVGQTAFFYRHFYPSMRVDAADNNRYAIAQTARSLTSPDASLIVIGDDWSSLVPYYAQRMSLDVPFWVSSQALDLISEHPQSLLGSHPFGGIVYCTDRLAAFKDKRAAIQRFVAGRTRLAGTGDCALLSP